MLTFREFAEALGDGDLAATAPQRV